MLKRRNSKRANSLSTAYTGVNTPPPNAMQPSSAALAAASSVGTYRTMSMTSDLSAAAAATALRRYSLTMDSIEAIKAQEQAALNANRRSSSLTSSGFAPSPQQQQRQQQQRPMSMAPGGAGVRRSASLTGRPVSSYGGLQSSPGVSAGVTHHPQPAYRSTTKRVTNPDRTQSLTTTTVRKLGSFEITTTNVVPLNNTVPRRPPAPRQQPKKGKAVAKKKSAELVPPRRAGYASSILSYDSELNAVEEEEPDTIEGRFLSAEQPKVRQTLEADLKHRPPPRSLSPMKSALKDSSRSGSVVSLSSQDERQARRNTRVSFTELVEDETEVLVVPAVDEPKLAVPNSAAKLASSNIASSTKMKQKIMTTEQASKKNQTSSAAFAAFTKNQEQNSPPRAKQPAAAAAARQHRGRPSAIGQLISKDRPNDDTSESGNSLYSDAFEDPMQANLMEIVSAPAPHSTKGKKKKTANNSSAPNAVTSAATAAAKGAAAGTPTKVEAQRKPSLRQRIVTKSQPSQQQKQPVYGTALSTPPRVASPRSPLAAAAAAASDKHAHEPRTLRRDDPLARSAAAASNSQTRRDLAQREFRLSANEVALENGAAAAALREGEELERQENDSLQTEKHHSSLDPVNEDEVLNSRTASPSPPSTSGRKVLGSPIQSAKIVDDDASSIDSDDSWRARREARRKQGGGGFAGFRRVQEMQPNPELYHEDSDSDYAEEVAPRGDTPLSLEAVPESPEVLQSSTTTKTKKVVKKKKKSGASKPRPVSAPAPVPQRPLTAQELATQMMKNQRLSNTDYLLKRTPSNSSFERTANTGGERTGFSLKTMRTNSSNVSGQQQPQQQQQQPQQQSYFNHPITETRSGSRFKSRFEDSDSDDDFALPPLPESPLDQPMQYLRTTAASPASAPPGRHQRSNSGGKLKGMFSPARETKFLVPKKHSSAQEMRAMGSDGGGGFSSAAANNYDSHFRTHMTGGPSDSIAPMKKKKFMGLRKVFGLKD